MEAAALKSENCEKGNLERGTVHMQRFVRKSGTSSARLSKLALQVEANALRAENFRKESLETDKLVLELEADDTKDEELGLCHAEEVDDTATESR